MAQLHLPFLLLLLLFLAACADEDADPLAMPPDPGAAGENADVAADVAGDAVEPPPEEADVPVAEPSEPVEMPDLSDAFVPSLVVPPSIMSDADRELVAEQTDDRFESLDRGLGLELPTDLWEQIPVDTESDEDTLGEEPPAPAAEPDDALPTLIEVTESEPEERAGVAVQRYREGPWRVVCYRESEIVFEHDQIYRVWMEDHHPPQWGYETVDGVRFRGRMGTDLNCNWRRL